MHIVTRIPYQKKLAKGGSKELSKKANFRLKVIDWYNQVSAFKSASGKKDASLTCRHFGIERSYFYRWYGRFKKQGSAGLEEKSRRPKRVRTETVCPEIVEEIKRIRQKNPTYSAKKIRPILLRYYEEYEVPSVSTISNIIKRHNFFFRADTKSFKKRSKSGQKASSRKRISGNMKSDEPLISNHFSACRQLICTYTIILLNEYALSGNITDSQKEVLLFKVNNMKKNISDLKKQISDALRNRKDYNENFWTLFFSNGYARFDSEDISVLLKKLECDENYELDIINKYFDESKRYLENIEFKILPKKRPA